MFKKAEADRQISCTEQVKAQEDIQVVMHKLQTLKGRISELRCQCEKLRRSAVEHKSNARVCSQCGNEIENGQEVVIRDSTGTETGCYHRECFQEMLK